MSVVGSDRTDPPPGVRITPGRPDPPPGGSGKGGKAADAVGLRAIRKSLKASGAFRDMTDGELQQILDSGVRMNEDDDLSGDVTRHMRERYRIPIVKEVVENITEKIPISKTEKKVIHGTELIPVQKFRDVIDTKIEYKTEKVKGFKTVWKPVQEPYEKEITRPVEIRTTKKVPYTDYEERPIEKIVEVPVGVIVEKNIGTQKYNVAKDQLLELSGEELYHFEQDGMPHLVSRNNLKVREVEDGDSFVSRKGKTDQGFATLEQTTRNVVGELGYGSAPSGNADPRIRKISAPGTPRSQRSNVTTSTATPRHRQYGTPGPGTPGPATPGSAAGVQYQQLSLLQPVSGMSTPRGPVTPATPGFDLRAPERTPRTGAREDRHAQRQAQWQERLSAQTPLYDRGYSSYGTPRGPATPSDLYTPGAIRVGQQRPKFGRD